MRGGGYEGGDYHSMGIFFGGFSWICREESLSSVVGIGLVQGAPVCWGFWARGPGYPYGILELGSCPSWQGGTRFWAELVVDSSFKAASRKVNKTSGKWRVSIRPRYFKLCICFILLWNIIRLINLYAYVLSL
jgi:hypothetical protein